MARNLFDTGIFSILAQTGAIEVGALLNFYTAETLVRISTYTTPDGSVENSNPVEVGADGRLPQIWIDQGQSIKYVLTDPDGANPITVDNVLIPSAPPSISAGLYNFLAGTAALPIANGGTGQTSAANAISALGGLPLTGGTMTGQILQSGAGAYLYNADTGQAHGKVALTIDSDPDPTTNAGEWWAQYT